MPMQPPKKMTGRKLAEAAGISEVRVSQLRRQGLSDLEIRSGIRRRPNSHDGSLITNGHAADHSNKSLIDLHREKLLLDNERRKLELEQKRGSLIATEVVQLVVSHMAASFRAVTSELLELPQRLRDRVDARPGGEVEGIMRSEVEQIIERLHQENIRAVELLGERVNAAYRASIMSHEPRRA